MPLWRQGGGGEAESHQLAAGPNLPKHNHHQQYTNIMSTFITVSTMHHARVWVHGVAGSATPKVTGPLHAQGKARYEHDSAG